MSGPGMSSALCRPTSQRAYVLRWLSALSRPARQSIDTRGHPRAGRLIDEMRSGATPDMAPKELAQHQVVRLHQLLHEARFADPDGAHLSPAGANSAPGCSDSPAPCLQRICCLLSF